MDEAKLCDGLLLLHHGKVLASGNPEEMLHDYPYSLYRVHGSKPLTFPARNPVPSGLALVYPSGGELHAAAAEKLPAEGNALWKLFPGATDSGAMAPTIEDLLFALLSREEQAVTPA